MSPVYAPPPATPPAICQSAAFVDVVGTPGDDRLEAYSSATRVWGLAGNDRLYGSFARASCLLGGPGNDVLYLNGGGGVAHGNTGRDFVFGSNLGDVIDPGKDDDQVLSAAGDDKLVTRDRRAELIDCGKGADIVKGDRSDVLVGCESTNLAGKKGPSLKVRPSRVDIAGTIRFRRPVGGDFQVLYLNSCREPGQVLQTVTGRTVRVLRPTFGWCPGKARLAVVRDPGYGLPLRPVVRLAFTVR